VGREVVQSLAEVIGAGYDHSLANDKRSYRNFFGPVGFFGFP
jgi:hypothetical protein